MREFKFLTKNNSFDITNYTLPHFDAYESITICLISWCYRRDQSPIGHEHPFYESGLNKYLVITDVISHDYFECRHVRIRYDVYHGSNITNHTFHIREMDFENLMRIYENI